MISELKILNNSSRFCEEFSSKFIKSFAQKHELEIVSKIDVLTNKQAIFEFSENKLSLHMFLDGSPSRLHFDLNEGRLAFRAKSVSKNNELISRAIGIKPNYRPKILDATAGMGRDSLIMAKLGCNVIMQERCLPIYLLLENALTRLYETQIELKDVLTLKREDSIGALSTQDKIDVIYLDPMFPARKKSALVKKEMRLFKRLAGDDLDSGSLLKSALAAKVNRVVVKRPKGAEQIMNLKPTFEILSKNFRFDIYLDERY